MKHHEFHYLNNVYRIMWHIGQACGLKVGYPVTKNDNFLRFDTVESRSRKPWNRRF